MKRFKSKKNKSLKKDKAPKRNIESIKRHMGAMPPPHFEWQLNKTVEEIRIINEESELACKK